MEQAEVKESQRLYSLDAIRGFDMFWIMGAEDVFHNLSKISDNSLWNILSNQFNHAEWNGFTFYDLIFPLFLFLAGVSTPFSVEKKFENGYTKNQVLLSILRRGIILMILGVIYNNGLEIRPIEDIRFPSVLGRIALAYVFANIIYIYAKKQVQVAWFFVLLLGYWGLLSCTSAPGYSIGNLTMQGNIASYLDTLIIPGKLYLDIHDPEGLVSTIPAVATALLGIYTGKMLKSTTYNDGVKTAIKIAVIGTVLLFIAQIWNLVFPINKNLWTSSFALQCGGLSMLLMALFYYIIDVLKYRKWAFFFKIIGMNSILIYMSGTFIDWKYTTVSTFKWLDQIVGDTYNLVIMAICLVFVQWLFLYIMYKGKLFLRV